jgi:citrate lyase subunit beta/citryl-CoA lyase
MTSSNRAQVANARSLLFVPGHRPDRFDKAVASGTDLVVLDLEDAVAPDHKDRARQWIREWLDNGNRAVVRINGRGTQWYDDDVEAIRDRAVALMVPKAESRDALNELADALERPALIPLIETAAGVSNAAGTCRAAGVIRPAFGSVDLAAQLGVHADSQDALRYARSALVIAAAAAGCAAPIEGVTTAFGDHQALRSDIEQARTLGFTGKLCIHPSQVPIVNNCFAPSDDEIAWARAILAAATDGSVAVHDGHMIDRPVLLRAQAILATTAGLPRF